MECSCSSSGELLIFYFWPGIERCLSSTTKDNKLKIIVFSTTLFVKLEILYVIYMYSCTKKKIINFSTVTVHFSLTKPTKRTLHLNDKNPTSTKNFKISLTSIHHYWEDVVIHSTKSNSLYSRTSRHGVGIFVWWTELIKNRLVWVREDIEHGYTVYTVCLDNDIMFDVITIILFRSKTNIVFTLNKSCIVQDLTSQKLTKSAFLK